MKRRIHWKARLLEAVSHALGYKKATSLKDSIVGCKIIDVEEKDGITALIFNREGKRHILFTMGDTIVVTENKQKEGGE